MVASHQILLRYAIAYFTQHGTSPTVKQTHRDTGLDRGTIRRALNNLAEAELIRLKDAWSYEITKRGFEVAKLLEVAA